MNIWKNPNVAFKRERARTAFPEGAVHPHRQYDDMDVSIDRPISSHSIKSIQNKYVNHWLVTVVLGDTAHRAYNLADCQ